jgi:hypothetical protein
MAISNATFLQGIYSYLRDYPEAIDAQTQDTFTTLAKTTFETAEDASLALAEFVEGVQRSDKPGLKKIVQALFTQEIERLVSTSVAEAPLEKRPRHETGNTGIGIQDLSLDPLAHVFYFLDPQSKRQAAQVCRDFRGAMRLRRIFDVSPLQPLNTPAFRTLSSLFGISLPPPNPSSSDVSAACEALFAKASYILEGVKASDVLSYEEREPFSTMSAVEIVQDPSRLKNLLHTAYEISLVAPFFYRKNAGPELPISMTLAEKAEAVRKHLKEKGDSHTKLECDWSGMLCFPTEFCSLKNLQKLDLSRNRLTSIPPEIERLAQLRKLGLFNNRLTSIPAEVGKLTKLQRLDLSHNSLTSIPAEIGRLTQLQALELFSNRLTSIPAAVGQLVRLQELDLSINCLTTIPPEIGQLVQLQALDLDFNDLTSLPDEIGQLAQLRELSLNFNRLTSIPAAVGQLAQLQALDFCRNLITTIPAEICRFTQDIRIFLANNPLTVPQKLAKNIHIIS